MDGGRRGRGLGTLGRVAHVVGGIESAVDLLGRGERVHAGVVGFAAVQRHPLHRAGVATGAAAGLVFVQSFTQTLGRYVHLVVADGVFSGRDRSSPSFFAVPPPTRADLEDLREIDVR